MTTVEQVLRGDARWCVVEGDALDVLRGMADGAVDAVITDPPYDERTHAGARTTRGVNVVSAGIDFAPMSTLEWAVDALRAARRWVLAFCSFEMLAAYESAAGRAWIRSGIWHKPGAMPQLTGDRPAIGGEAVAIMHRKGRKRWNGGGRSAFWSYDVERGEKRHHPTQKPVRLMLDLVRDFTDAGEVILDPFGGSGTTGVAALAEGRRVIIVERDPVYAAIARARCEAAATGRDWRRPEQASLFGGSL